MIVAVAVAVGLAVTVTVKMTSIATTSAISLPLLVYLLKPSLDYLPTKTNHLTWLSHLLGPLASSNS